MTQYLDNRKSLDSYIITDTETGHISVIPAKPAEMLLVDLDDDQDDDTDGGRTSTGTGLQAQRRRREVIDSLAGDIREMTSDLALRLSYLWDHITSSTVHHTVMNYHRLILDACRDPRMAMSYGMQSIETACKKRMEQDSQKDDAGTYSDLPKGSPSDRLDHATGPSGSDQRPPDDQPPPLWTRFLRPIDGLRLLRTSDLDHEILTFRRRIEAHA